MNRNGDQFAADIHVITLIHIIEKTVSQSILFFLLARVPDQHVPVFSGRLRERFVRVGFVLLWRKLCFHLFVLSSVLIISKIKLINQFYWNLERSTMGQANPVMIYWYSKGSRCSVSAWNDPKHFLLPPFSSNSFLFKIISGSYCSRHRRHWNCDQSYFEPLDANILVLD